MSLLNNKHFAVKISDDNIFCSKNKFSNVLENRQIIKSIANGIFKAYQNVSFQKYWQDDSLVIQVYGSNIYLEERGKLYANDIDIVIFLKNEMPHKNNKIVPEHIKNEPAVNYSQEMSEYVFVKQFTENLKKHLPAETSTLLKDINVSMDESRSEATFNKKGVAISIMFKDNPKAEDLNPLTLYIANENGMADLHKQYKEITPEKLIESMKEKYRGLYANAEILSKDRQCYGKAIKRLIELAWMVNDNKCYTWLLKIYADIKDQNRPEDLEKVNKALLIVKNNIIDKYTDEQLTNKFKRKISELNIHTNIVY